MEGLEKYYEFSPCDQRLINAYLRPKIAGEDVIGISGCIHDADVTSDHPYDLVRKHEPARGSGSGTGTGGGADKGVWFFFSPKRYVGSGSGSRLRNRARTVLGVDGRKKGAWHTEGRKKTVPGTAGGFFQKLSYEEVTPSRSVVKPGWLMVEYAIEEDRGGGGGMVVLCKVYKSPRGPGSDVSLSRKRKAADVVEQMQRPCKRTHEDAAAPAYQDTEHMFLAGNLLHKDLTETDYSAAAPANQETEHKSGGGESAASAGQCTRKTDQVADEGQPRIQEDAMNELTRFWESSATGHDETTALDYLLQEDQPIPSCAPHQTKDEDDVMEIRFEEFRGSSSLAGAAPPPCVAQPEDAAVSCVQMSEQKVVPADDDDEIEFTLEELMMGSSMPGGYSSMPSPRTLTDDDEDDDDDDMRSGLACPPMDYAILEALVELGPAIMEEEEEDFICDL
ncbi:hypothetical protein BDA96_01G046800 [Sorghum bicolor]|jgi:hypothetical protein|uniref:NAC domain-containing protein n=2 Tax=Sorghum bicolor TaxID=4558 RepID=C5WW39_SORBI|nr:hypothetical protein SORBI_3001G045500 [Sorghum bicolor]KAG0547060.1 hypothetical protein BDA96_01G046800 [Sorghum bicolor]